MQTVIQEDTVITTRQVLWPYDSDFFAVVGEQYCQEAVARMQSHISKDASLTPPTVVLLEDDDNQHDDHAVAVLVPYAKTTMPSGALGVECEHVGFLPRDDARHFRRSLRDLGFSGRPVEAAGCIVAARDAEVAGIKLFLPRNFVSLVKRGFADNPANTPAWLVDQTPIAVKQDDRDYSDDEYRRLYCRYAQLKSWNSLPYMVDEKVAAWQQGIGPVGLAVFFHRTGVDKYSEEGKQQLKAIAKHTAEAQLTRVYKEFDDLGEDDLTKSLHEVSCAAGDAGEESAAASELVMLQQLKGLSQKKFRGLATGWQKLGSEAAVRIKDTEARQRFLAFAEQKTLFLFSVLLSDAVSNLTTRARSKPQLSAQRLTIEKGIATTVKQAEGLKLAGVTEELNRFTEFMQAQLKQLADG